jgi:DNA-binding beta-propeller fold protein YncE
MLRFLLTLCLIVFCVAGARAQVAFTPPLTLSKTIQFPTFGGKIAGIALDEKRHRLFLAVPDLNYIEVYDTEKGVDGQIKNLEAPQGIAYIPEVDRLVVTNSRGGGCTIYEGEGLGELKKLEFTDNADQIRYDAGQQQIFVGYGNGGIGVLDAHTGKGIGNITLIGHPRAFELEKFGPRLFVNIPESAQVAVIDKQHRTMLDSWPLGKLTRSNHAMAFDEPNQRLFVATRSPARLLVYNTKVDARSRRIIAELPCGTEPNAVFYDGARKRVYVNCEQGVISSFKQKDADHYLPLPDTATTAGASAAYYAGDAGVIYVGVPRYGGDQAAVHVFEINP